MTRSIIYHSALLMLSAGCLAEPQFHTFGTISVQVPHEGAKGASDGTSKSNALQIIDRTLLSQGFTRDTNNVTAGKLHAFASYARFDRTGIREVGYPQVLVEGENIKILFTELGNRTGRLTPNTRAIMSELRTKL